MNIKIALLWLIWCIGLSAMADELPLEALQCQGCHGPQGISQGSAIPTIAGMSEEEMLEIFNQWQTGQRDNGSVMARLAIGYNETQIKRITAYFAAQPFAFQAQVTDPQRAKRGETIHRKFCNKCHTREATSNRFDAPILAGQKITYLRYSLEDFLAKTRPTPEKMNAALHRLTSRYGEAGLEDVIHYYASRK